MITKTIEELAKREIYSYGSTELTRFEQHMSRYFEREYKRWEGNKALPEKYGVSSFKGDVAHEETHSETIDHYNNELNIYRSFLDDDYMAYTMAYYGATDDSPKIDDSLMLEQAQEKKYKLLVERAEIKDGQNILDLGCGFGGFIKYLLEEFPNVKVTGVNPSTVQCDYIRSSTKPYETRLTLVNKFIGEAASEEIPADSFDRIVSIGALEHFSNFDLLFKQLATILKSGGKCLHHVIVSVDTIPQFLNAEDTLMSRYFPGGHIWPYSELKRHTEHLTFIDSWFINGLNYWKTLDTWHQRFWKNIDTLYPKHMSVEEVDQWNKYFSLCKTMFNPNSGRSYGNGHYLYKKK